MIPCFCTFWYWLTSFMLVFVWSLLALFLLVFPWFFLLHLLLGFFYSIIIHFFYQILCLQDCIFTSCNDFLLIASILYQTLPREKLDCVFSKFNFSSCCCFYYGFRSYFHFSFLVQRSSRTIDDCIKQYVYCLVWLVKDICYSVLCRYLLFC